jgi:hypothetical protein
MSFEWPSAAAVSLSFQVSGAAAAKTPSLPQFAPPARTWLMRASRLAWKSGRLHVDALAVVPAGALADGLADVPPAVDAPSPPPPHEARHTHARAASEVGARHRDRFIVVIDAA